MDEQLVRVLSAIQLSSTDLAGSTRALEKIALALVVMHPNKKELIALTEYLLQSDAILRGKGGDGKEFCAAYLRHGTRLLAEMRASQANA